ncbi:DsbA family oxidoreductase [Bacillus suaedaesalsae]|uniref:DsbA family oxidoreductase n=1 Tax=Bacillus suaedaesalsae TaxID=2810349 RepID=A0ABS2DHF1_9BACI|nr:DsbA family oxidoreductase [Bacillus suaedaesalsae]
MGKKRLEDALTKTNENVKVVYRSFQLDPTLPKDINMSLSEAIAKKYGISIEQSKANNENIKKMALEVGLDFQLDTLILTNTFDAHRLTMLAKKHGLMNEMTDRLLHAYYTESKHIGDHQTLVELAKEIGLDEDEVKKMLSSNDMAEEVQADQQEASELGIRSIPFFLINRKYTITGAQPTETFVQAIEEIAKQDGPFTEITDEGVTCDENGCEIPKK